MPNFYGPGLVNLNHTMAKTARKPPWHERHAGILGFLLVCALCGVGAALFLWILLDRFDGMGAV